MIILKVFFLQYFSYAFSTKVPLIVLGVDGYGYRLYEEFGNKSSGDSHVLPIKTVFPSKTFPNFMSIATGLYPTQHGLVSNRFLNKKMDEYFLYEDEQHEDFDWFKGQPIWITARKAGLKVYTDMWVGSTAKYEGLRPNFYSQYNKSKTLAQKANDLVANMDSTEERCDLYVLYTSEPDSTLHVTDMTDKVGVKRVVEEAEEHISAFKSTLGDRQYNLVIVSDHGMSPFKHKYILSTALRDKARQYFGGSLPMWYTRNDKVEDTVAHINKFLVANSIAGTVAMDVAKLPDRLQMCGSAGEGLPEILFLLEDEYAVDTNTVKSGHGYDNDYSSMFGQVRVSGPAFTSFDNSVEDGAALEEDGTAVTVDTTINTELYNLFCSLLGIQPADNTGSLDTFDNLLKTPPDRDGWEHSYQRVPPPCAANKGQSVSMMSSLLVLCSVFYDIIMEFLMGK